MEMNEIREGMKVRHQFEHGKSFGGVQFTYGVVVNTEGMKPWRPQVTVEIEGHGRVTAFVPDLVAA